MRNKDWDTIRSIYEDGVRSLRDIASEFGVTEGAIRKQAKRQSWERNGRQATKPQLQPGHFKTAPPQPPPESLVAHTTSTKYHSFGRSLNVASGKNAYAVAMMLDDDLVSAAEKMSLSDELIRLRALNLMGYKAISKYRVEIDDGKPAKDRVEFLLKAIQNEERSISSNTQRIESIENTMTNQAKTLVEIEYRRAATMKLHAEIEAIRAGDNTINATIVHNALPIPGRT